MVREDKEYQILAGANLDEAIQSSNTTIQTAAPTEVGSRSESEMILHLLLLMAGPTSTTGIED
jgi:hypothetical protein